MFSPGTLYEHMYDSNRIPHDQLMYRLISTIAKEGKDEDGKPNGHYYIHHDDAIKFVQPYIAEHLPKLTGDDLDFYMKFKVEDIFTHMDVLGSGFIEAEQMGRFIREVVQNNTLNLH